MDNILDLRRQAAPLAEQARAALAESDITILRCAEAGVPVPPEWAAFRAGLRAITGGRNGAQGALPARPDYPAGTS